MQKEERGEENNRNVAKGEDISTREKHHATKRGNTYPKEKEKEDIPAPKREGIHAPEREDILP